MYISYDGAAYHGWQMQPNAISVQQKINEALSTLLRINTEVVGAGRTDAGVNAAMLVAHFDSETLLDCECLADKTYHYTVYTHKNPFNRHYGVRLFFSPDYDKMNLAARHLIDVEDFTSFSKVNTDTKTNICHVTQAEWVRVSGDCWRFEISADRFLRNMVRAIVGTLLDVGRGKITEEDFIEIIKCKNRCSAGESVPGNALSLVHIDYPDSLFEV